ncbi:unnamed protein product [Didymodactylos carnosus]|uniref:Uncharacterized protein n=1 Tax=Didymodactylos carnosus TaxID=1234261 RepID=A0A814ZTP1_9BILA|nr:unnamed protein product [Didymodactylos carnosus]CAF4015340.1 unnamed protein product [Didymodactylos carnosus]
MKRQVTWEKYRKMIVQLLTFALIYLIFVLPTIVIGLIQTYWFPTFLDDIQFSLLFYLYYYLYVLTPIAYLISFPRLLKKLIPPYGDCRVDRLGRRILPTVNTIEQIQ